MNANGFSPTIDRDRRRHGLMRRLLAAAAIAGLLVRGALARADTGDPEAVAKTLVNQALSVLNNSQLTVRQKQESLRGVVEASFDFTEMSRSALGTHWRTLTPDQQREFTRVFTQFIEDSYLSKVSDYRGQTVTFTKVVQLAPGYTQVNSKINQPNSTDGPISLDYRLKYENGQWKIYDVTVDAISIIANYRNQFNRVINDKGFPTLMADLRAKSRQLANALGE
jgi:phospholipid transport system substrate-binding protein